MHKRMLDQARDPGIRPIFEVRLVQVQPTNDDAIDSDHIDSPMREEAQSLYNKQSTRTHPPPTFGSSQNLEALALQANNDEDGHFYSTQHIRRPMHEITFSSIDMPKLLSQLTAILSELGLNIEEAHVFSTTDGFSLDVFVVHGWPYEETEMLKNELESEISKIKERSPFVQHSRPITIEHRRGQSKSAAESMNTPTNENDEWEIDFRLLQFGKKVASGSYGHLYKGTYCSQEVAIKVLKPECVNSEMLREFSHEIYIMRKIRHKNVVQFMGACTRPSNLCIVTEFMSRGSVYNFLHKEKGSFKLPILLKVAIDVSKGMDYLHQNNIVHRDLKTANLLMDEHDVVKVADFGVSRVQVKTGVMTAETGTYRWMAPEVIEHKPYDHKADVFSFGIVLWELLTGEIPYSLLTPLQAAVGVVQKCLRPTIPESTHPKFANLLEKCWQQDPTLRPNFSEILEILRQLAKEVGDGVDKQNNKSLGSFFSFKKLITSEFFDMIFDDLGQLPSQCET
ncbi:hypothetical protein Leryth_006983 [Lithospermum erythrorhizon]|nr:hypothetical protein Leryth_006983 [Lithospermum erythrorhizon]